MAIYTGVADANGDFNIPFSTNYTGGEKITVTSEKDAATKSIELFAPSEVVGGGVIQFSGDFTNFPNNIGVVTLKSEINRFTANNFNGAATMFVYASGLRIETSATSIAEAAFRDWVNATSLYMNDLITSIANLGFYNWQKCNTVRLSQNLQSIGNEGLTNLKVTSIELPASLTNIGLYGLSGLTVCEEIICRAITPPSIASNTFNGLKSTCIFKVPAASVAAYQAATNWSAFASRIQAI